MQIFKKIDQYTFLLSKFSWSEDDKLTSICIDLQQEDEYSFKGDVRVIWPEALMGYLELVFKELFTHDRKSYKDAVMLQLKDMYKRSMAETKAQLLSKIDYPRPLFKHQLNAICLLVQHRCNLLSFDMGLGKTITSATISKILNYRRTVIIAPSGVKWNWLHDMCDDWGYDPIHWTILDAVKSRNQYAFLENFVVTNYENVEKHRTYLEARPIDHFIIDEAHLLKNSNTKRFVAVKKLLDKFPQARITLLTGTPITNRIDDMFSYYKLTGHVLGKNKSEFSRRYLRRSNGESGKVIGGKNIPELRVRHSNMMIRKRTEECIDLPPLLINKYWMDEEEMSKEYHELIKAMYQNRIALSETQDKKSISQLQNLVSSNVHSLNRILATCKVKKVIELIDQMWAEGKKVVVFSGYTDPLNMLEQHYGDRCVKIDGSVNSYNRSVLIEKYKKEKNCHVFLGNNKAAGVGINLVNACDVITMNFPFTPDDIEQPYKRTHRIGQKNTVNVYFTIVKNSIDEHIYSNVVDKSIDINNLIDNNRKGTVNYESDVMNMVFNRLLDKYAQDNNLPQIPKEQFQEI